ncbi:MAG: helix-turn-helix transcriptional regulator [Blastocatellia bacterium]|nr:helix-turn-helix transcriptional regulator [Blastocatellia bacterium]
MKLPERATWNGILHIWSGGGWYIGTARDTKPHAHHALQIALSIDGQFLFRGDLVKEWILCDVVIIAPNIRHQTDAEGRTMALYYLDADSKQARQISETLDLKRIQVLEKPVELELLQQFWQKGETVERMAEGFDAVLKALCKDLKKNLLSLDSRVETAIERIRSRPSEIVSVEGLASEVGLSVSRFSHLFREQTGLSVQRYRLWMKLRRGLELLSSNYSLTEVAHESGFSDSSHFTRTFRQMFGIAPSELGKD